MTWVSKVGLFLNAGEFPGQSHTEIYDLLLAEAELAERLGYFDLWVTEHHFISFGINASALTAAAYLLGHTRTLQVGTAVALSPQYHPGCRWPSRPRSSITSAVDASIWASAVAATSWTSTSSAPPVSAGSTMSTPPQRCC